MKKLSVLVSLVLAFALSVWAQTPSPNDSQSGSNSSTTPSATQGSQTGTGSQDTTAGAQPGTSSQTMGSQGSSSTMGQGSAAQGSMGTAEQGKMGKEHKLKGCLESQGGTYELREKGGKEVALTGASDLSQYANHEVVVHGDWSNGSAGQASSSTSDMSKAPEKQFTVSKIESVSDTCKGAKHAKDKDKNPSSQQ